VTGCARPGCGKPATTDGHCESDYRYLLHTGQRGGFRDPSAARGHVMALRGLGWTWQQIADAAGTSNSVPFCLASGRYKTIRRKSEVALLSVPLLPAESHRGVNAAGTRRRVPALAWMGWSGAEIARRAGCHHATLHTEIYRGSLSVRLAGRVRVIYRELSATPGPSRMAAVKARQFGYAPPAAWDGDEIDDPRARPKGVRKVAA
jgi:hypothetical protein